MFESSDDDNINSTPSKVITSVEQEGCLDDGYYIPRINSKVGDYTVTGISGKGVFASVVKVQNNLGKHFAIKIMRVKLDVMR